MGRTWHVVKGMLAVVRARPYVWAFLLPEFEVEVPWRAHRERERRENGQEQEEKRRFSEKRERLE